jgi:mannosyltransferase OCH1-like enzyme
MLQQLKIYNVGEKIRVGNQHDGGYVIPKLALEHTGQLFSYGINNDITFDEHYIELTQFKKKAFGFDHTIDGIKTFYGDHFTLFKEGLSALETPQTNNFLIHFERYGDQSQTLLKIDVEGAEYEYFLNTDCFFLSKVAKCIVVEFHWLSQPEYRSQFVQILHRLNPHYHICHVHGNNHDTLFTHQEGNSQYVFPNVIEITFVAKDICEKVVPDHSIYPTELDNPNHSQRPDIDLSFLTAHSFLKDYAYLKTLTTSQEAIPKIIYRTSPHKVNNLPTEILNIYRQDTINNPEYEIVYFDDDDCQALIEDTNDPDIIETYNGLIPTAFKADFFRYVLLHQYGGIYLDFSHHTLFKYDDVILDYPELFLRDKTLEYGINNSFMACIKGNKVVEEAIKMCIYNVKNKVSNLAMFEITGTVLLERAYKNVYEIKDNYVLAGTNTVLLQLTDETPTYPDKNLFIVDMKGNKIVKYRSLADHYKHLYGDYRWHYSNLYYQRLIYKDERMKEINDLYNKHLLRNADTDGLITYWRSGMSIQDIETSILGSTDYQNLKNR